MTERVIVIIVSNAHDGFQSLFVVSIFSRVWTISSLQNETLVVLRPLSESISSTSHLRRCLRRFANETWQQSLFVVSIFWRVWTIATTVITPPLVDSKYIMFGSKLLRQQSLDL